MRRYGPQPRLLPTSKEDLDTINQFIKELKGEKMNTNEVRIEIPTAEEINQKIVDSVASSMIGRELEKAIKIYFDKLTRSSTFTESAFSKIVKEAVDIHLAQVLKQNEYQSAIRKKIEDLLTEKVISDLVDAAFAAYFNKG